MRGNPVDSSRRGPSKLLHSLPFPLGRNIPVDCCGTALTVGEVYDIFRLTLAWRRQKIHPPALRAATFPRGENKIS